MKIKNYYLIASLIILFVAVDIGLAQTAGDSITISVTPTPTPAITTIGVKKGTGVVPLKDALTEENGKKVLIIDKSQIVELSTEAGVTLQSENEGSVKILDNKYLLGITADTEAEILVTKDGEKANISDVDKFTVKVKDADASRQIIAQSTFLSYKTVKDNFGKKFAQSFFVIQVDIRNETLNKQFIVQTLDVIIDPNQCWNGRFLYEGFNSNLCIATFKKYFIFPAAQQGVRREEVIASGKADLNRSNRNLGFRILAFAAGMGSILTGFNGVLGPDGVKGVNVLGTTVSAAANGLFPNTADEKLENLKNAVPTEDVIIKSKESKTFNIFIPTERVFYEDSWKEYIKPARNSSQDTYTLKAVLDLLLLSSATGVLVDNDAPKVQVKSDDNLKNQKQKFNIVGEVPKSFVVTSREAVKVLDDLEKALETVGTKDNAVKVLRDIVASLNEDKDLERLLSNEKVTTESGGKAIIAALRIIKGKILQDATLEGKQDELVNKINETIVELGK